MPFLRDQIEKNPRASAAVAAVVLFATIGFVTNRGPSLPGTYFYDIGSQSLYVAPAGTLPPAIAPSGSEGVIAVVFSCGDCTDETSRFIGYLQTFTDDYRTALDHGDELTDELLFSGQLFRAIDDETWHPDGPEAAAIVNRARSRCEKDKPVACSPM